MESQEILQGKSTGSVIRKLKNEVNALIAANERLKCCGNCWKYPAANYEFVCEHYGEAAGCDTDHVDECWEASK